MIDSGVDKKQNHMILRKKMTVQIFFKNQIAM